MNNASDTCSLLIHVDTTARTPVVNGRNTTKRQRCNNAVSGVTKVISCGTPKKASST